MSEKQRGPWTQKIHTPLQEVLVCDLGEAACLPCLTFFLCKMEGGSNVLSLFPDGYGLGKRQTWPRILEEECGQGTSCLWLWFHDADEQSWVLRMEVEGRAHDREEGPELVLEFMVSGKQGSRQ